jgi:Glycosyl hydrolases family 17
VLLRGELSSAQLAGYLHEVRAAVNVPVTYADVWEFWLRHPELASSVDYITIHILPYWEDRPVPPEDAVQHVADVYEKVQKAFPGQQVMIGETGWPSAGRARQAANASLVNEARYLREFLRYAATVQMPYNVIEAFDQPWKREQEGSAGGYWGIFDRDARPKFAMVGPVTEEPRWWAGWLVGLIATGLFVLVGSWRRRWQDWRGVAALALMGFASGCALAWQFRQMWFACRDLWEWTVSLSVCVLALVTMLLLARWIAARLADVAQQLSAPAEWLRLGWLFVLTYYGLRLVFDGRYRDLRGLCAGRFAVRAKCFDATAGRTLHGYLPAAAGGRRGAARVSADAGGMVMVGTESVARVAGVARLGACATGLAPAGAAGVDNRSVAPVHRVRSNTAAARKRPVRRPAMRSRPASTTAPTPPQSGRRRRRC